MMRRILCGLILFAMVVQVNAQALPARIGQQIAAVVKNKVGLRGFAANDPRFGATVAAVGTAVVEIGTAVVAAGTAPAWGTVLASAVIAGAVGYGVQALANWLFNKDGTITVPGQGGTAPSQKGPDTYLYGQWKGGSATGVASGYVIDYNMQLTRDYPQAGASIGVSYCETYANGSWIYHLSYSNASGTEPDWNRISGSSQQGVPYTCDGLTVNGACQPPATLPGSTPAQTVPAAQALAMMSDADKAKPLPDQVVADLADAAWRQAANQPGYAGVPYSLTDPVTQADVATARAANPAVPQATVGDLAEPVSASNPLGQTSPSTAPATNPAAGSPQVNLGDDPGIGFPTLEATPTAQQIIDPLAGLAPSLKSWAVPAHMAECPKPTFDLFNKHIVMDQQCFMFEDNRATLYNAMLVAWALIALFIVLSA